jgi:hypothetical protein
MKRETEIKKMNKIKESGGVWRIEQHHGLSFCGLDTVLL